MHASRLRLPLRLHLNLSALISILIILGEELLGEPHNAIHFMAPAGCGGRFSGLGTIRAPAFQHTADWKFSRSKSRAAGGACLGLDDAENIHHAFLRHRDVAAR
jgi:hypothetical protein